MDTTIEKRNAPKAPKKPIFIAVPALIETVGRCGYVTDCWVGGFW